MDRNKQEQDVRVKDQIRGCLMAGAAGDALGYPVEFMSREAILAHYGPAGITRLETRDGKALVSDDTQMTLFTANGILMGITRGAMRGVGGNPEGYVQYAYLDWYYTQTGRKHDWFEHGFTWLRDLPELAHRRAPGNTCLSACDSLLNHRDVENDSKGCGGIMRVAPMGLLTASYDNKGISTYSNATTAWAGAEIARCTHKHPLGFLPAALLTHVVHRLALLSTEDGIAQFTNLVTGATELLKDIYQGEFDRDKQYLTALTARALELASSRLNDHEAIAQLGQGWTGEEAWAIAVYCVARHLHEPEQAVIAAVNHDGDSDSTGAIAGNIVGVLYGLEALERRHFLCPAGRNLTDTLELADIILALADDISTGCIVSEYAPNDTPEQQQWLARYVYMKPAGIHKEPVYRRPFVPGKITSLKPNEIFVFGSNLAGSHGGGAALAAWKQFGAVMGQGVGLQGQSYAIPTMQGGVETIKPYTDEFIAFAASHPELTFLVTRIGCGIAGFSDSDIAPLFREALPLSNVLLPRSFVKVLNAL